MISRILTPVIKPCVAKFASNKKVETFFEKKAAAQVKDWVNEEGKPILRYQRWQNHLPPIMGVWITAFYIANTYKSKEIPEERKMPLALNFAINTIIGLAGGYPLAAGIRKCKGPLLKRFEKEVLSKPENLNRFKFLQGIEHKDKARILKDGMNAVIPLFAFTMAFRFIGAVVATPLADKAHKFLINKNLIQDPKAKKFNKSA